MYFFAIVIEKTHDQIIQTHGFFQQPIDELLLNIIIYFGWIPFVITLLWGFSEMWLNYRESIYRSHSNYILLAIDVPAMTEQSPKALENLFANLYGAKSSILWKEKWYEGKIQAVFSFEIVSTEGYIQFYVSTQSRFRDVVEAGIYAHYPQAEIYEVEDYTKKLPDVFPDDEYELWGTEMKLKNANYLPIRTYVDFEHSLTQGLKDPLAQVLEELAKMKLGEHFWVQFVTQAMEQDWKDEGTNYIREAVGYDTSKPKGFLQQTFESIIKFPVEILETFTGWTSGNSEEEDEKLKMQMFKAFRSNPIEKERVEGILNKCGKIGFKTKTRIVYIARKSVYWKQARTALVKGMLHQYSHHNMNSFGLDGAVTPKDDYFWQRWVYRSRQTRLIQAYKARSDRVGAEPSILNSEELASLWHFPDITIRAPLVKKVESRRSEPPVDLSVAMGEAQMPLGEPPLPIEDGQEISSQDFEKIFAQDDESEEEEFNLDKKKEGNISIDNKLEVGLPSPKAPTDKPQIENKKKDAIIENNTVKNKFERRDPSPEILVDQAIQNQELDEDQQKFLGKPPANLPM
ncbi:MAG: hypothetical protein ABIH21_02345 [Patescibacteria group bacterium]